MNLTRAVGQTMARLADWEVATLVPKLDQAEAGPDGTGSRLGAAISLVEQVNGPFEALLVYAWRRHLAAAVARVEALGPDDEDAARRPRSPSGSPTSSSSPRCPTSSTRSGSATWSRSSSRAAPTWSPPTAAG